MRPASARAIMFSNRRRQTRSRSLSSLSTGASSSSSGKSNMASAKARNSVRRWPSSLVNSENRPSRARAALRAARSEALLMRAATASA